MTPKPVTRKPGSMPRIRTVGAGTRGSSSPQAGAYEALAHLALQVSQVRLLVAFSLAVLLDLSLGARFLLGLSRRLTLRPLRRLALVLAARERRCDHHRANQHGE